MDVIVDLDGSVANIEHRLHFIKPTHGTLDDPRTTRFKPDWDAFNNACEDDLPNEPVCELVRAMLRAEHRIAYLSGRNESVRAKTQRWIFRHLYDPPNQLLYMRADGDYRPDEIVKKEFLLMLRSAGFNPQLAIDDRRKVVDMWRAEGIVCAQVAEGDF